MRSTRDRFHAAISGAPTTAVAAGVVTAMHLANMRELFQELEMHLSADVIDDKYYQAIKDDYTA